MDFLLDLAGMLLLLVPGALIASRLDLRSRTEYFSLSILFSFAVTANFFLLLSYITPVQPIFSVLFLLVCTAGLWFSPHPKKSDYGVLKKGKFQILLLGSGLFVLGALLVFATQSLPNIQYDVISYHGPFVDAFAEQGRMPTFSDPQNSLEVRFDFFPKLYEALIGGIRPISPGVSSLIPVFLYGCTVLLLIALARRLGYFSLWGAALFVSGKGIVYEYSTSLNDVFLSALFLGALILLSVQTLSRAQVIGILFLVGAMLGTKLPGVYVAVPIMIVLLWYHHFVLFKAGWMGAWSGLLGGVHQFWTYVVFPFSSHEVGAGNLGLVKGNVLSEVWFRVYLFFYTLVSFMVSQVTPFLLTLGASVFLFFRSRNQLIRKTSMAVGMSGLFVFLVTIVTESNIWAFAFPRFLYPAHAAGGVLLGFLLEGAIERIFPTPHIRRVANFTVTLGIFVILLFVCFSFYASIQSRHAGEGFDEMLFRTLKESVPDSPREWVYFANTANGVYIWNHTRVADYITFPHTTVPACAFLREKGITRVVVIFPDKAFSEFDSFNRALLEEAARGDCGPEVGRMDPNMRIYHLS